MCEAPEWRPHAAWSPGPTTTASAKNAATSSTSSTGAASSASPASPDDTGGVARIHAVLRQAREWVQAVGDREEREALVEQLQEAMMQVCRIKTEGSECLQAQRSDAVSYLFSVQEVVEAWAEEEAPPVEPEGPPLAELNKITEELSERRTDVLLSLLSGELSLCPARARRLASALSSLLLRLDSVEARGRQDVRRRRRAAVARTELLLRQVEPWTRGGAGHDPGDGAPRDPLLGHRALPEIRDVAAEAEDIKRLLLALPMRTTVEAAASSAASAAVGVVADGGPRPPRFRRARRLSNGSKARGKHAGGLATGGGEVDDEAEEDDEEEEKEEERGETEEQAEEAGEEDDEEGEEERLLPRAERRLLALMERLDRVESGRNPYVRQGRRRAVLSVQGLLAHLELRRAVAEGRARQVAVAAPSAAVGEDGRSSPVLPLHPAEKAILQVLLQLCSLQREALAFRGDKSERGYALLDELLTKQLLSLDAVDTAGWAHGREARRHAVRTAQSILAYLDAKSDDPED